MLAIVGLGSYGVASAATGGTSTDNISVGVCTNQPGTLALGTQRLGHNVKKSEFQEIYSPEACDGQTAGVRGIATSMRISPQYDPMEQVTMIRFENDLGEASYHPGVCTITPGNLAVFNTDQSGMMVITVLYVPELCGGYNPSPGA